jgi:hypothetical protein
MKKAQISGELLRKFMIAVFVIVIILFGINSIQQIREKQEEVAVVTMKSDISNVIEESVAPGISTTEEFNLPKDKDLCFIDLSKRSEVLESSQIRAFPEIKDVLESGVDENVFILKDNKIIESSSERICLDDYPYFTCTTLASRSLNLMLEGRGKCTAIFFEEVEIAGENVKDLDKYPEDVVFFIHYKNTNWRELLRLIPVTMWNDKGTLKEYPYIIYHTASGPLSNADVIEVLNERDATNAIVFDSPEIDEEENIKTAQVTDDYYFSFWEKYQDIVLIGYDNEESALIAALYAAELNAPLIFVDSRNIEAYEEKITHKKAHIIDTIEDIGITDIVNKKVSISSSELRAKLIGGKFAMLRSEIERG